jgi:hypothetical protein
MKYSDRGTYRRGAKSDKVPSFFALGLLNNKENVMPSETQVKAAFEAARKFYSGGFKSANKKYDANKNNISWWKRISGKASRRTAVQPLAAATLRVQRSDRIYNKEDPLGKGRMLYNGKMQAANCGELACVTCFLLLKEGVPANQLAVASVSTVPPVPGQRSADHAFCLYGSNKMLQALRDQPKFRNLDYINKAKALRKEVYAIDPWANLWCSLDEYTEKMGKKMASWGRYGKRVLWVYGPNRGDHEWCNPAGQYKQVFSQSPFRVSMCG